MSLRRFPDFIFTILIIFIFRLFSRDINYASNFVYIQTYCPCRNKYYRNIFVAVEEGWVCKSYTVLRGLINKIEIIK